jgi:hypothetical protein
VTTLQRIASPTLTYNENSKGGGTTPTTLTSPTLFSVASTRNLSAEELKALLASAENQKEEKDRQKKDSETPSSSGGANASTSSASGKDSSENTNIDSMLAALLGGGQQAQATLAASQSDLLVFGGPDDNKPNIFEYASFRYRSAAYEENRLRDTPASAKINRSLAQIIE